MDTVAFARTALVAATIAVAMTLGIGRADGRSYLFKADYFRE